ncbi:hypothetical protein QF026_005637 [Streptomyces aurantiacus]|nr:hypothetical protein [Streptomyces aurantiacus]
MIRLVVATTDPATLPETCTWYLATNLPRPGSPREAHSRHPAADLTEVVRLHRPEAGTVILDGEPVRGWRYGAPRSRRTAFGVVFQQPRLSADPRLRLADLIAEPLCATGRRADAARRPAALALSVGLTPTCWTAAHMGSATASSSAPASPALSSCVRAG